MQTLNPLLTDDQDVSKVKKLERKYKLKILQGRVAPEVKSRLYENTEVSI